MPTSPPTSAGYEGSILLVEEYDALAAAITAALRKFAPRYELRVFRSLALASENAAEASPDLVLIDFDPPQPDALKFLEICRNANSETRVIVIAAGLPRQFLNREKAPAALTFVEKPFQLEELGACIQRLLPPLDSAPEDGAGATLNDLNLADVIPLLGMAGATEIVKVNGSDGSLGEVHFARGQIQHAAASGLEGIDALREMMRWPSPNFVHAEADATAPRSIEGKWATVFDQVQRSIPSRASNENGRKKKVPRKRKRPAVRDGKKILVIDDTEPLRDFVEEMLSTANPRLQIRTAADGTEGLQRCLAFRPDLILLDYSLPDFNGDEVCRRLLADETTSQIPVIMMSGHIAEMTRTAESYENVVLALAKPFVSGALVDAVTATLETPPVRKRRKVQLPVEDRGRKQNGQAPVQAPPLERPAPAVLPVSNEAPTPSPPTPTPTPAPTPAPTPTPTPTPEPAPTTKATPPAPAPAPSARPPSTPAHIPVVHTPAVVLSLVLEVVEMNFSSALHLTFMRARPSSRPVLLHIDPRTAAAVRLQEAAFEIDHVELDAHGQMVAIRVAPTAPTTEVIRPHANILVDRLAVVGPNGGAEIQVTPTAGEQMRIQLLAAFHLTGVELSPAFGVAHLALKTRSRRMRAVLPGPGGKTGIIVEASEVRRDAASRISEISLRAVAVEAGRN